MWETCKRMCAERERCVCNKLGHTSEERVEAFSKELQGGQQQRPQVHRHSRCRLGLA